MEPTTNAPQTLYVFLCMGPEKHKIIRKTKPNNSTCSKCERPTSFRLIAEVPEKEGESEVGHFVRAALTKERKGA